MHINLLVLFVTGFATGTAQLEPAINESSIRPSRNSEEKLFNHLFTNLKFGATIRPVIDKSQPVQVQLEIAYVQLIELNERQQYLKSNVWIRQVWQNDFLTWDPDDFDGVEKLVVDKSFVWVPDLILHDSVGEAGAGLIDQSSTRIEMNFNGQHNWYTPMIITSKCNVDITFFPFDIQRCILRFGSWTYDSTYLNLTNRNRSADIENYLPSSELELLEIPAKRHVINYASDLPPFTDVTYTLSIRRLPGYYVFNVIIPSVAITALCLCTFAFPEENSGRMSFVFSCVLALVFVSHMVSSNIPLSSDTTPLISVFMLASIIQMSLAGVFNVVVTCFYRESGKEIPYWMRVLFFNILAPFSGVMVEMKNGNEYLEPRVQSQALPYSSKRNVLQDTFSLHSRLTLQVQEEELRGILADFGKYKSRDDAEAELSYIRSFWQCTANVADRLFLIAFLSGWMFSTFFIVWQIPLVGKTAINNTF